MARLVIVQTLADLITKATQHPAPTRFGVRESKLANTVYEGILAQTSAVGATKIPLMAVVEYDFAEHGGAIDSIELGVSLPDNSQILNVTREVITAPDSATDSGIISLNLPTDGDLDANIAADGAATSAGGASIGANTTPPKTTAARELTAVITVEALTAGRMRWYIQYYPSV